MGKPQKKKAWLELGEKLSANTRKKGSVELTDSKYVSKLLCEEFANFATLLMIKLDEDSEAEGEPPHKISNRINSMQHKLKTIRNRSVHLKNVTFYWEI